jgi:hypothetical protein
MRSPWCGSISQPLCDLVEEPHLVIAGGSSAEQASDALLGLLHVHATLPPLDNTAASSRAISACSVPSCYVARTVRFCDRDSASPGVQQAGYKTHPSLSLCGGPPHRNRTGDPILTIDAPVLRNACDTSHRYTTAQVRTAVGCCIVRRSEAARGAVSGKSLARLPCVAPESCGAAPDAQGPSSLGGDDSFRRRACCRQGTRTSFPRT